jgi:hypothetical protein
MLQKGPACLGPFVTSGGGASTATLLLAVEEVKGSTAWQTHRGSKASNRSYHPTAVTMLPLKAITSSTSTSSIPWGRGMQLQVAQMLEGWHPCHPSTDPQQQAMLLLQTVVLQAYSTSSSSDTSSTSKPPGSTTTSC